jgi:oligoendopeptidase F
MPLNALPTTGLDAMTWSWTRFAPYFDNLTTRTLTTETVDAWLADWTQIAALLEEINTRFIIGTTTNTADSELDRQYKFFLDEVQPHAREADQRAKAKLIASGLEPAGFELPLRNLRTEADLYRETNLPLLAEQTKLVGEYEQMAGARTIFWDGHEIPLTQIFPAIQSPDRDRRERAWRTMTARVLQDTDVLADIWRRMLAVRARIATNAGCDSYRAYRWRQLFRFDYTPDDMLRFHDAIERVVVPAARRLNARRRARLRVPTLRPWDLEVDPAGRPPLRPYHDIAELEAKTARIFHRVDPQLGAYFETMRAEHLLDLDSRPNKAPGGYSLAYEVTRRPFIFANSVGIHDDVQTLLHEGGHAFHTFEMAALPYLHQRSESMVPIEFAEVASMGMELLAAPYLTTEHGGFYSAAQAARARIETLESFITFWPYMAMIDALQHWIYAHPEEAADLDRCDAEWAGLADRFQPDTDWSGLERERGARWHRQGHVFGDPFYFTDYGISQLGAVQLLGNALTDQAGAVAAYRRALQLGGTAPLPTLYATAGARFAFDAPTLQEAVDLIERVCAELEPIANT